MLCHNLFVCPTSKKRIERERLETEITDEFIETLSVVTLVQGVLTDGQPHYAYVRIPKDRYSDFKRAEASGSYDLRDFGEILCHGEGLMPSADIVEEMRRRYGTDHHFEDNLMHMAQVIEHDLSQNDTIMAGNE